MSSSVVFVKDARSDLSRIICQEGEIDRGITRIQGLYALMFELV